MKSLLLTALLMSGSVMADTVPPNPAPGDHYFDGCNTHTYIGGGAWSSTLLSCSNGSVNVNEHVGEVNGLYSTKNMPNANNWIGLATSQTITFRISDKEVLSFGADGVTKWNGHVVESDGEFKAAIIKVSKSLSRRCLK